MMTVIAGAMIVGMTKTIGEEIETVKGIRADNPQFMSRKRLSKHEDARKVLAMTLEMTEATEGVHEMIKVVGN